jgi:Tfp pilus assembly protein PilO
MWRLTMGAVTYTLWLLARLLIILLVVAAVVACGATAFVIERMAKHRGASPYESTLKD